MSAFIRKATGGAVATASITAVPTLVPELNKEEYIFNVDTTAGDVDFTGIGTIAGVQDGTKLTFRKVSTDTNSILFSDAAFGGFAHDGDAQGDIITLLFDAETASYYIV